MRKPLKSVIIAPHSKGCFMKGREFEWSGIIKESFFGNFKANRNARSTNYLWYSVKCNDPKCEGLKAVDSKVLINAK